MTLRPKLVWSAMVGLTLLLLLVLLLTGDRKNETGPADTSTEETLAENPAIDSDSTENPVPTRQSSTESVGSRPQKSDEAEPLTDTETGIAVFGRVLQDGLPVAGAAVLFRRDADEETAKAVSDADGRYRLICPRSGSWHYHAFSEGLSSIQGNGLQGELFLNPEDSEVGPVDISLYPALDLTLRVISADTGEPVAGASIETTAPLSIAVNTDKDGRALLVLGRSLWRFSVSAGGFMKTVRLVDLNHGDSRELVVALKRGGAYFGRVVDAADGKPLAGVSVREFGRGGGRTVSDKSGMWRMEGVDPGKFATLEFSLAGYQKKDLNNLSIPPGTWERRIDVGLVLRAESSRNVVGRVVNPAKEPVADARVVLVSGGAIKETRSDENGDFLFPDVPNTQKPGQLIALSPDFAPAVKRIPRQKRGESTVKAVLKLTPPHQAYGRVVDHTDQPLEGVRVQVDVGFPESNEALNEVQGGMAEGPFISLTAGTDADGYFLLDKLPARVDLHFEKAGWAPVKKTVKGGAEDMLVVMQGARFIEAVVVDEDTGRPLPRFTVRSQSADYEADLLFYYGSDEIMMDNPEGRFTLGPMNTTARTLRIAAEGYQARVFKDIEPALPGERKPLRFELKRGGLTLNGKLVDDTGRSLGGVKLPVSLFNQSASAHGRKTSFQIHHQAFRAIPGMYGVMDQWTIETQTDGRFRLENLPGDKYLTLEVNHPGLVRGYLFALLSVIDDEEVVFTVPRGSSLAMEVNRETYPNADHVRVYFAGRDQIIGKLDLFRGETGAELNLRQMLPSDYSVHLMGRSTETGSVEILETQPAVLNAGEETRVRFGFEETVSLTGRALVDNRPPRVGLLVLTPAGSNQSTRILSADLEPDGRFNFPRIYPGTYQLILARRPPQGYGDVDDVVFYHGNRVQLTVEGSSVNQTFHFASLPTIAGRHSTGSQERQVTLDGRTTETGYRVVAELGSDGNFSLPMIPPGNYRLYRGKRSIRPENLLIDRIVITADGGDVNLGEL
ncbi:MAG: carboxypeptidase regulatory-like domain-containing protein [Acidobacteriota bacterium]|nr:carboxypeptidase regulatory-like domain-containing protein [Acidobacteriota bacterium]